MSARCQQHLVQIDVDEEDTLSRYRKLTLALATILTGRTLIRINGADYESGHIEMIVEAERILPPPDPAEFRVSVEKWAHKRL